MAYHEAGHRASPSRTENVVSWVAQILAAVILGQTLFFKFTGADEAKAIFTKLGAEPWGRIGTGVVELVTVVLLLRARTAAYGGVLAIGLMLGAIGSHLGPLGIEVEGDGGLLFGMGIVTLIAGIVVAWIRRADLPFIGSR